MEQDSREAQQRMRDYEQKMVSQQKRIADLQKSNTNAAHASSFAGDTFGGGGGLGLSTDTGGMMDNLDMIVDKVQYRITTQFELAL